MENHAVEGAGTGVVSIQGPPGPKDVRMAETVPTAFFPQMCVQSELDESGRTVATRSWQVVLAIIQPEEEGGYSAFLPCLPGCISEGETIQEAREALQSAYLDIVSFHQRRGSSPAFASPSEPLRASDVYYLQIDVDAPHSPE